MYSSLLASATLTVWRALEHLGYDADSLFQRAGADPNALRQPGARYPMPVVSRLWELVMEETRDPCIGLEIGRHWHPSAAHALGYAWLASDTLKDAFQRLVRYFRVITTDKETVELRDGGSVYVFRWDDSLTHHKISDAEYDEAFAAVLTLCRISAGKRFSPKRVRMRRSPPPCESEFSDFFRCQVDYSAGENSIHLPRRRMEATLPSANIQMARECDRIIDAYLGQLDRDNVAATAKARLIEQLPSGSVSEQDIAKSLNVSVRSLQRKLGDEGTTFKQLLDDTRRELALQYIKDPTVTINEMTYLLGYSEPANFSRAFKRWTGRSPRAVRAA